ncbi:asparagine synthetase B family protein [Flaviaesturariibacter terrae]
MCGLAGIVSASPQRVAAANLGAAIGCLRHRGPEPAAFWTDEGGHCRFAHGRLSIIDPDPRSRQPFSYDRFTVVYNGELYNYVELRDELRALGHSFQTASDTEVLCAAWAAWGPASLDRFDGAFAFALWDPRDGCLYAARDRFGEKPFYFYFDDDTLLFASELRGLWQLGVPRRANDRMAYNFLTLGYVVNPANALETFYQDVSKLPAGHWLRYEPGRETLELNQFGYIAIDERATTDEAAIETFRDLFATSVRRRLRSDVAVGTSLSGGLDSASVLAYCRRESASPTYTHKAFTAVFPGFERDERRLSELVASRFGVEQHFIDIKDEEVPGLMDRVQAQQEEPVGSASALAQYAVFAAAKKEGVTVLLDGQGADEVLAGYEKYYRWYWRELLSAGTLGKSGELEAARALGVPETFGALNRLAARMPHFSASLQEGRRARLAARMPFLHPDWARRHRSDSYYMLPDTFTLNGALHYNTFTNGLEELLRLADRNSMAHSLELRLPFLSPELVTFLFQLPARFKIREGRTKWILRKAMEGVLPDELLRQPRKTGFEPPQARWMTLPAVQERILAARRKLVEAAVLDSSVLAQKVQPHGAYAAAGPDWKYWALSYLY